MDPRDGKDDFGGWAWGEALLPDERVLLEAYLSPGKRTLEAGCGGGRILLELARWGFEDLHGFDFVPEFIEVAKQRDPKHRIDYAVGNACSLSYPSESFDQVIYLQQILCFIESPTLREKAVSEAFRILKPGGVACVSFLCFEGRWRSLLWRGLVGALLVRRKLFGPERPTQLLPWLRKRGRPNFGVLLDRPPYGYWFKAQEAVDLLTRAGFKLLACSTTSRVAQGVCFASVQELLREPLGNMLYVVATK